MGFFFRETGSQGGGNVFPINARKTSQRSPVTEQNQNSWSTTKTKAVKSLLKGEMERPGTFSLECS